MPSDQPPHVTVKTELGSSYKRLPSFRSPRDLKLSQFRDIPSTNSAGEGRTKKVFVPNLNVHRKRTEDRDEGPPGDSESSNGNRDPKDRGRGTGERGRGRGRGRKSREYIQQTGVFSQGLAPSMKPAWHGKSYDGGTTTSVPKPKLKLNENLKVTKEEEEEVMKELLRDDFLDDPDIEADLDNAPVELPLQDVCKWEHIKDEKPFCSHTYPSSCYSDGFMNGIKVKPDPEAMEMSEVNGVADNTPVDVQSMRPLTLAQLLSVSQEKNFLFFQIPHRIPKLRMNVNPSLSTQKRTGERQGEEEDNEASVLRSLPQGRVGTLQIRKSGRAVLVLGDVKLNVEPGTQSAFKQDLVSVNLENSTKSGNMINMGKITTRILVTPDWKHLLNNINK